MNDITVDELYDYILKDASKRKQQVRDDVHDNLLSAKWLNTLLLGEHPEVFKYNPDTELDHIDSILGKPQGPQDKAWVEDANYEQLPEDIADKVNANNAKADRQDFTTNELPEDLQKNSDIRSTVDANRNMHSVIFDKILSNVRKNPNMTDEQKKLLALRILYNNNTPGRHKILPDIKLTQGILREELSDDPIWEEAMEKNPQLLNKDKINTDYLPLTYDSDKVDYDDITWDEEGNEYKTKRTNYLFHPLENSRHVYDIFVNNLIDDIHNNSSDIKNPYSLAGYIINKYANALKVMSYDDWEKEFARLDKSVDKNELEARVRAYMDEETKKFNRKIPYTPEEINKIRDMFRVVMSDPDIDEDKILTYEDLPLPDLSKIRDRAKPEAEKAEKAENKLHRMHGTGEDLEEYKRYLADRARVADPDNFFDYMTHVSDLQMIKDKIREKIYAERIPSLPDKLAKAIAEEAKATNPIAKKGFATQIKHYSELIKYYDKIVHNKDPELAKGFNDAISNAASRIWSRRHRKKYNLYNNEDENYKEGTTLDEQEKLYNENSKYKGPDTRTNKLLMEELDRMFSDVAEARALAREVRRQDYEDLGYDKRYDDEY